MCGGVCGSFFFFFQAEDGIRDLVRSRGLGDVYKRQVDDFVKNCNSPGAGCGAFSMNTAKPIADQSTTTSPITVPAQGGSTLTDLNVYVDISHTYSADLRISLTLSLIHISEPTRPY